MQLERLTRNFEGTFPLTTVINNVWCHCPKHIQIRIIAPANEG